MLRRVPIYGYVKFEQPDHLHQGPRSLQPTSKSEVDELKYFEVQLLKDEVCGTGSYGKVCKAMVDQLICAAKIIHSTFFAEIDPSSTKTMLQFQKECEFLSTIRHPCIVQYLGTTQDIETGLPVLLMELMDESLTQFLSHTLGDGDMVLYHVVVNLCHDIAMALAFLHSNGIVHRDLSSNNILMVAGEKAKVTDFGMARLIERNRSQFAQLTQCPGTFVYMPPEALRTPPTYTAKLDIFSAGVILIQIISGCFPSPGNAKRTVSDSRHGTVEIPIPERERRKRDLVAIPEGHPLLGTILDCLADFEVNRLSSKDLCHRMIYYKTCSEYKESKTQEDRKKKLWRGLEEDIARNNQEIGTLKAELDEARSSWERDVRATREEKDLEIARLREELEHTKQRLTEAVHTVGVAKLQSGSDFVSSQFGSQSFHVNGSTDVDRDLESASTELSGLGISEVLESRLSLEAPPPSMWYHGPVSRMVACQRLEAVGTPGAYLIRESSSERGVFVLSFLDSNNRVHHFRIVRNQKGQFNIGGDLWFSSLPQLVAYHTKYSSVMENIEERLDVPVPAPSLISLPSFMQ